MKTRQNSLNKIVLSNLKKDLYKNILSASALFITIFILVITVGIFNGSKIYLQKEEERIIDKEVLDLTKHESVGNQVNNLNIIRTKRPSKSETESVLKLFNDVTYDVSLNPLIVSGQHKVLDEEFSPQVIFVKDFNTLDLTYINLVKPVKNVAQEVLINDTFASKLQDIFHSVPNNISFYLKMNIASYNEDNEILNDEINIFESLDIVGYVSDSKTLKQDKIYYSHLAWRNYFEKIKLNKKSLIEGVDVSLYDYLWDVDDNNALSNFAYKVFFSDYNSAKRALSLNETLKSSNVFLEFTSLNNINLKMSRSLVSFIKLTFSGFFAICLIGGLIILSIITYTKIIKRKKQIALLTALNAPKKTIFNLYLKENLAINLLSLLAFPVAMLLNGALNKIIYKYLGLENIIEIPLLRLYGVYLLFPIILILGIFIVTFVILGIVFNNIYKKPLILSLNSE